jgi:hypothetical protein
MPFISILDYILLPFYLFIIFLIAFKIRDSKYPPGHPWRPYFIPGLTVKICGAIGIGLIYQYYYGGGDTSNYFFHAQVINSAYSESTSKWFNLVFHIPKWYDGEYYDYISRLYWYEAPSEYTVASITALLGIFTFTTYLPISVLFGTIAFTGIWALFRTFATQYPAFTKYIAWCVLFIPSTVMWGSGIFKDTICMCCLGWLTYGAFRVLINRDFSIKNIIVTIFCFYLVAIIKVYILIAFIPALLLWIVFTYSHSIQSSAGRFFMKFALLLMVPVVFLVFSKTLAASLGKYSLENVAKTSYTTRTYINSVSGDEGSGYDLGAFDPSLGGMLKKFPLAVNVTLFRPYIWETRKVFQLINALEALLFLWVTLKVLFTIGPRTVWRTIKDDPTIQFCLIFAIVFAFAVGISSYNFGALSRYRIPCLPFYAMALVLIYYKNNPIEKNILSLRRQQLIVE